MFRPTRISQVTNPLHQNVIIVGGDNLFDQGRNEVLYPEFLGAALTICAVGWYSTGGTRVLPRARKRWDFVNSQTEEIHTPVPPRAFAWYRYGWFIMRNCTTCEVRDGNDEVLFQYPEQ